MPATHAFKKLGEKNYLGLEEYLDLILQMFDIGEDTAHSPSPKQPVAHV